MAEVTATLSTEAQSLSEVFRILEQQTKQNAATMGALDAAMTKIDALTQKQVASSTKQVKVTEDIAKASILASKSVSGLSSIYSLNERSTETLTRISQQYSDILKETGQRGSELEKAWRQGLSPAEKTALKIAELGSKYAYAGTESKALGAAVTELGKRLEDQQRRADTNVGSQNKLSRSLSELMDEANNARLMVGALNAAGLSELNKTATATKQRLDAVETAMSALSIPGADLVARGRGIADAFETMTEFGGKWGTVALAGGVAIGTVTAAVGTATIAIAGLTAAVLANSAAADEWNDDLKKLDVGLTGLAEQRIDRAAASIDAMGSAAKRAGVAIAYSMAPDVQNLATTIVAAELAVTDLWNQFAEGGPILGRVRTWIVDTSETIRKMASGLTSVPGLGAVAFALQAGMVAVRAGTEAAVIGIEKLEDVTKDYRAEAEKLIGAQLKLNDAEKESERQVKATAEARDAAEKVLKDELDTRDAALESYLAGMDAIAAKEADLAKQSKANDEAEMERLLNIWQIESDNAQAISELENQMAADRRAAQETYVESMKSAASSILAQYAQTSEVAFRIQQGIALAQVGMDTATAIVKGIALFGPPPSPVGIAAIAAAAAIGGAQAIMIANQEPPAVSVSDAYIPAGGPRNIQMMPGDEALITRSGELGRTSRLNGGDDSANWREQNAILQGIQANLVALKRSSQYDRLSRSTVRQGRRI